MISICLKSSNINLLNSLEQLLDKVSFEQIYYSQRKFKIYNNLIIHYLGNDVNEFYNVFSDLISSFTINHFEKKFIQQQLNFDFFYFSADEKESIKSSAFKNLNQPINIQQKKNIIKNCTLEFFTQNSQCILDGFINFRLYNYQNFINLILEKTINDYVIKKEYIEYVDLLYEYIHIQPSQTPSLHLVYSENIKLLLDDSKNIITDTSSSKIYLSDISFSSNDFILNSLLSLLPQKLYIHLENNQDDNFITFLKSIFNDRAILCDNCAICSQYFSKADPIKNHK